MKTIDQRKEELLTLPSHDRASLAVFLIRSLDIKSSRDSEQEDTDTLWEEELDRRWQEIKSGADAGIPAEEVFEELRKKYP